MILVDGDNVEPVTRFACKKEDKVYNQPTHMPDDVYKALTWMIESPWYKWTKACGMKKSFWPWKITRFIHYVKVTKMAISRALSYEFYPETYIPNVKIEKTELGWSLYVQIWGHPDIQKI